jgi:hypothetical protein
MITSNRDRLRPLEGICRSCRGDGLNVTSYAVHLRGARHFGAFGGPGEAIRTICPVPSGVLGPASCVGARCGISGTVLCAKRLAQYQLFYVFHKIIDVISADATGGDSS